METSRHPPPAIASGALSPNEVAGVSEIATMLEVTRRTAARYVERPDFPEPAAQLLRGRVWLRADVEVWAKANLPLKPGRPRKGAIG